MTKTEQQLRNVINKERQTIPIMNLWNFNLETEAYIKVILANSLSDYERLVNELWEKMQRLKSGDKSHVPPYLPRYANEDGESYIDRCYEVGGYVKSVYVN
jgi:hypothetical protein